MTKIATQWDNETRRLALKMAQDVGNKFVAEVDRLLGSGALPAQYSRGLLFGVAIENVSSDWLRGSRSSYAYRNLRRL